MRRKERVVGWSAEMGNKDETVTVTWRLEEKRMHSMAVVRRDPATTMGLEMEAMMRSKGR